MTVDGPPRVRMAPDTRREQLLSLGVRLLSTRSLDELSIDVLAEEAGISRGLLYHYFGNKRDFHRAVVRRAADDLIEVTAPVRSGEPMDRLAGSLAAYVDYVLANLEGYTSLVRGAAGGDEDLREIYEEARAALTDRIFDVAGEEGVLDLFGVVDSPAVRLMVRGWSAMVEDVVLSWVHEPSAVPKDDLLAMLAGALPGVLGGGPGARAG
jgi:AcrR family transcriptional regulator